MWLAGLVVLPNVSSEKVSNTKKSVISRYVDVISSLCEVKQVETNLQVMKHNTPTNSLYFHSLG